ncbi:hypothetical protein AB0J83_17495 [Actinoplanes sp. NPDC049596]|uniref:hypothetical protein n=1 Tax=unclassified Actinoplanes TaxID=2626549 RepID=UPI00342DF0F8
MPVSLLVGKQIQLFQIFGGARLETAAVLALTAVGDLRIDVEPVLYGQIPTALERVSRRRAAGRRPVAVL